MNNYQKYKNGIYKLKNHTYKYKERTPEFMEAELERHAAIMEFYHSCGEDLHATTKFYDTIRPGTNISHVRYIVTRMSEYEKCLRDYEMIEEAKRGMEPIDIVNKYGIKFVDIPFECLEENDRFKGYI